MYLILCKISISRISDYTVHLFQSIINQSIAEIFIAPPTKHERRRLTM